MADTARLDELERKFAENPRRYFAPLANEYRKSGDLATAIRLCREQLSAYPGHMSGHVVLGQALYESRQPEDAQRSFERALELDPENLIALRHLGDIARDRGDGNAARGWYQRVLEADPRNDDIAAQLQQLAPAAQRMAAPAAEPVLSAYVAPPPPPAPVLEPLEWSALDLDLPGATTTHETEELPIATEPAAAPVAEEHPADEAPAEIAAQPVGGLLDLDDEEFALPAAAAHAETEETTTSAPETDAEVTAPPAQPALLDEPPVALDPVDWAELLPDEEVAEETPVEVAAVEAAQEPVAPVGGEPEPSDAVDATVADDTVISTIEEVWLPAATSTAVEVEETPAEEPVAESVSEPVVEMEPEPVAATVEPEPTPAVLAGAEQEPAGLDFMHDWEVGPVAAETSESAAEPSADAEPVSHEAGWVDAAPLDLAPELLDVVEPASEAAVESPLAEDAWTELLDVPSEATAVLPEPEPEPEPEPSYDPVVGLDLPPIATDEPEPYPVAAMERATPGAGVPSVPFVTETMAGLLLRQGHVDQALDVYEQLAAQRPDDEALGVRVAELRASLTPPAAPAVAVVRPADGGSTAGAFFAALVGGAVEPAAAAPADAAGPGEVVEPVASATAEAPEPEPTVVTPASGLLAGGGDTEDERAARRLADAFSASAGPATSLADALFVSPPSLPPAATPPAPPAAPADDAPYGLGDFSFERFFEGLEEGAPAESGLASGAPGEASSAGLAAPAWSDAGASNGPRHEPARPATPAAAMPAVEQAPATDDEDLAQFQAWLKGLTDS